MCDVYLWGSVSRISPEAPVPVFESRDRQPALGGAANVAANLQALGCEVRLLSVIGSDAAGKEVRSLLDQQGIASTWLLEDPGRPTTEKTRLIAHQQQMLRLDWERRFPLDTQLSRRACDLALDLLPEVDGVVCSDYQKGMCTPELLTPIFEQAGQAQLPIIVDPKARDFSLYQGATVIKPNLAEVEQASGMVLKGNADIEEAAALLCRQSRAKALLVTRGKDGMSLFQPSQLPLHIPANARDVFDVTGAGDTVVAMFSMAVLSGLSYADAAILANTAAGVVVGKVGATAVSPVELRAASEQRVSVEARKVLAREALVRTVDDQRRNGKRIVFTNGCFDLLHVGHMRYLQQARLLGDCLVIGLNDDASVRRLKGDERPLIPHDERASVLAALACVDYVTIFAEDTPLDLIQLLRPDVLVKGGDYTPDTVIGREEVESYGGTIELVPYVEGVSTSHIIDSVLKRYQ